MNRVEILLPASDVRVHEEAARLLDTDEEMFAQAASSGMVLWRLWSCPPCVVVGRHQDATLEADLRECALAGVPVIRRTTGGGAVFLDPGCLLFSVATPARPPIRPAIDFTRSCGWMVGMLASMGLEAHVDRNRVLVRDRKISGLAARSAPGATLVHGTLLVSTDLSQLGRFLLRESPAAPEKRASVRSAPWPETTLSIELGGASVEKARETAAWFMSRDHGSGRFARRTSAG